jgi:H+/Cl- antiporter ClcA/CBS domain-containing protein
VIAIPVIGAVIIGLMARYGSPKIRGHGIPEALEAILLGRSRIEPKVAVLKPVSPAISIGTGGPFGAEGPIIMTGGAFGSLFAQFFHLTAAERKTLLVAGAAAGMAAIFATPIAAILLAVELLLFEWKPRSFIPVAIASIIASIVRVPLLGSGPIFPVVAHNTLTGPMLLAAFGVGILTGFGSGILTNLVYWVEDFFEKFKIHWMWWPAIGAVFVGIGGVIDPRVLGVGYENIYGLLKGDLIGTTVIALLFAKAIVWSISLGSGTSGGVLAPLLMIGGALGALLSRWIPFGDASLWAMVGLAAMMAGTMRAPFTATIFALELTHDLNALPALMIGSVAAVAATVLLLRRSILTEKLARRGHHVTCEYSIDLFQLTRVSEVMEDNPPTVAADMTVAELSDLLASGDTPHSKRQGTLLIDSKKNLVGIITRGDIVRALQRDSNGKTLVVKAGKEDLIVTYPDEPLHDAIAKMLKNDIGRLPVVKRDNEKQLVGYLGRADIMAARMRRFEEEQIRERVFFAKPINEPA